MSINIFNLKNNIFVKSFTKTLTFIVLSFVIFPIPVLATLEPINYEIIPGTPNPQPRSGSTQTGVYYSDRIRPLSFYGLNAYEIQTHGASSLTDSQNLGGSLNNSINTSISAISASPSSNSIVPGGSSSSSNTNPSNNNSSSNNVNSNQNNNFPNNSTGNSSNINNSNLPTSADPSNKNISSNVGTNTNTNSNNNTSNQNSNNNSSSSGNTSSNPTNNNSSSAVPTSSSNTSGSSVSINIPSVNPNSYLSSYYDSGSVNNLSYGNNSYDNNNRNLNSFDNGSFDNESEAPKILFGNNNYGDSYDNQSQDNTYQTNDSTGLFSYINGNYVPGNYTGAVYNSGSTRSGSYSNRSVQTASVYSGAYNPKKQVAQVVEAPKEIPPAKIAAPCEPYLKTYLGCGFGDEKSEVIKLQKFLRDYEGYDIKITGFYDDATFEIVRKFQERYSLDVLKESWGLNCSTGCVYITTKAKINDIVCQKSTNYKNIQLPSPRPKFVCPDAKDVKSGKVKVTPEIATNCPYLNS